ncbi:unnamed protein product [Pleuronectes platessa]|uniref:Uncharacterized protein n=1 Tax=Pleuronectes platessa TaxID=8262 RepID=A0A9N7YWA5_PLEPL|nr:unnamed protein product [Pleuronectes platessa]
MYPPGSTDNRDQLSQDQQIQPDQSYIHPDHARHPGTVKYNRQPTTWTKFNNPYQQPTPGTSYTITRDNRGDRERTGSSDNLDYHYQTDQQADNQDPSYQPQSTPNNLGPHITHENTEHNHSEDHPSHPMIKPTTGPSPTV